MHRGIGIHRAMGNSGPKPEGKPAASADGTISTRQLMGHLRQLKIEHNGEQYTLRITTNNKLILTK